MKRTVLIALVILVAWPPLLRTRASAQAQTKDQHGWIGTETVKTRFGDFEFRNGYPTAEATEGRKSIAAAMQSSLLPP